MLDVAPQADEFRIYDDKAIHGWLEKQGKQKGYFAAPWKRLFVIVDEQKLSYYTDNEQSTQKGAVDFTRVKARFTMLDDRSFQLAVSVKGMRSDKTFTFKT